MMVTVLYLDDDAVSRLVFAREFRDLAEVLVIDDHETLSTINVAHIVLVICDRIMTPDWEAARDAFLLRVPQAIIVECSGGVGFGEQFAVPGAVASFSKYRMVELREFIRSALVALACPHRAVCAALHGQPCVNGECEK